MPDFNPQGSREPRRKQWGIPTSNCKFQSTRLSRASTLTSARTTGNVTTFQSTRLSRASTILWVLPPIPRLFQSTRLSRASTVRAVMSHRIQNISIHKALASLDAFFKISDIIFIQISIHKALASLDQKIALHRPSDRYFNPQGSREPRLRLCQCPQAFCYFNPQGSREPRPAPFRRLRRRKQFQSTRLSRASTHISKGKIVFRKFQSTRLSRASTAKLSKPTPHPP